MLYSNQIDISTDNQNVWRMLSVMRYNNRLKATSILSDCTTIITIRKVCFSSNNNIIIVHDCKLNALKTSLKRIINLEKCYAKNKLKS